jgi:hypothetical protein
MLSVGLAVTSHNNAELSNAKFKGFIIQLTAISAKQNLLTEQPQDLKVFPNPSDKRFSIDFNLDKQEDGIISIIETGTGRIIFTEKLLSFSGQYHKVFTKAMVPKGTYIITLKTNEGLQTKQFIME